MRATSILSLAALAACSGSEAISMSVPVVASGARLEPATTDLDYTVTIDRARIAARDLQLIAAGDEHPSLASRAARWLVGTAHAHPGHGGRGDVIGELPGDHLLELGAEDAPLGTATMLTGDYGAASFLFRAATELEAGDPLLGHSIHLTGSIARGDSRWSLEMVIDLEPDAALIGAPFAHQLREDALAAPPTVAIQLATVDPFEGDTAFDGVDFAALDTDGDGHIAIEPGQEAHNILRRALTRHDHYLLEAR